MSKRTELIKVYDKLGFYYSVDIEHFPHLGFSNAVFNGQIIAQRELNKINEPRSDDDREWEMYEDRFAEWRDIAIGYLSLRSTEYFNNKIQNG